MFFFICARDVDCGHTLGSNGCPWSVSGRKCLHGSKLHRCVSLMRIVAAYMYLFCKYWVDIIYNLLTLTIIIQKYCMSIYSLYHFILSMSIIFTHISFSFIDGLLGPFEWYYCLTLLLQTKNFKSVKL